MLNKELERPNAWSDKCQGHRVRERQSQLVKGRRKPKTVAGGSRKIQQRRKSTKRKILILIAALRIKYPHHLMTAEKVKANEESPTGLLQSKPKERHLVINFDIKGKIHLWSLCREMSQNHLGDANGSSACVPISLSLCKMFCSSVHTSDSPKCRNLAVSCLQQHCRGTAYV